MQKTYETKRLHLEILDPSGATLVADYYRRNRDFLEEWESRRSEEFYTPTYHEQQLAVDFSSIEQGSLFRLWLCKKGTAHKIIGCISFNNIVMGPFCSCFLGYSLDDREINQGFMTEALQKGIEIVFEEMNLHRIEANIMPRNRQSLRVAEKLGFYHEGLALKYLKINGVWEDHIHMIRLNENV
jgi:[ribosomal protein S5]-alanine N-acetyltransferase